MNKLLLSLVLVCSAATAGEYWTMPTEAGGEVVLTNARSEICGESLLVMYLVKSNQEVVYGCWALINDKIHVRYDNGIRRAYDMSNWTRKGTP